MAKVTKRLFDSQDREEQAVRINKFLSDAGVCSRREADRYVEEQKVKIDGVVAQMGSKVLPNQTVEFCGKIVGREESMVLIALNKPRGIVCTTDLREPDNVIDFLKYNKRIYPIGRLDKDSEGLLLLTNNGDIVNKILRAGNYHEKEYIVKVNKPLTVEFLSKMAEGVPILDTVTRPCTIEAIDKTTFRIILTQGLNRQIRRMCEYFDYRVVSLVRVRIMNVKLGRLKTGGYRNLTDFEIKELKELIEDSQNHMEFEAEQKQDAKVSSKGINSKNHKAPAFQKHAYKNKNFSKNQGKNEKQGNYIDKKRKDVGHGSSGKKAKNH